MHHRRNVTSVGRRPPPPLRQSDLPGEEIESRRRRRGGALRRLTSCLSPLPVSPPLPRRHPAVSSSGPCEGAPATCEIKWNSQKKKPNCSCRAEYRALCESSAPPRPRLSLPPRLSLINAPHQQGRRDTVETLFFCAGGGGFAHIAVWKHRVQWRHTNPPSGPQSALPSLHLLPLRCPSAAHLSTPTRETGERFCGVFFEAGARCVFVFASLCCAPPVLFIPTRPTLSFSPSLGWLLRSHSALRFLPLASLRVSFHHYLCFLRGT